MISLRDKKLPSMSISPRYVDTSFIRFELITLRSLMPSLMLDHFLFSTAFPTILVADALFVGSFLAKKALANKLADLATTTF